MNRLKSILFGLFLLALGSQILSGLAFADTALNGRTLALIREAVFEVVVPKPIKDSLSYERPLPLDLIPYSIRMDKYYPIGTAFALGPNEFVSAGHVMCLGVETQFGEIALRDKDGKVYGIDKIIKYSERKDFVVFSLKDKTTAGFFELNTTPRINQKVFAVGNALGEGIVIRDGLYTSATPEQLKGEWKWIRFSAAASPGNSGGPLLDEEGKVIGIISQKSPNENLNYALPIGESINEKEIVAKAHRLTKYGLDNAEMGKVGISKRDIALPKSHRELNYALIEGYRLAFYNLLKSFFMENKDRIFPNGKESTGFLQKTNNDAVFPNIIVRGDDGNWDASSPKEIKEADLSNNGRLKYGYLADTILLQVQKPDNISLEILYKDPKLLMDLILKGISLPRHIGGEKIKVTSMGNSREDYVFVDSYGRKWLVKTWLMEYSDEKVVTFSLPVPGGCITMMKAGQTGDVDLGHIPDLKILANFIHVSYSGTLKQWREFLERKDLLPKVLSSIDISFDYGRTFQYKSKRLSILFPADMMDISERSRLKLIFGYFREKEETIWDVGTIFVGEDKNNSTGFHLHRAMKPPEGLGEKYQSHWETVAGRKFPFNRSAYYREKTTSISAVSGGSAGQPAPVLYAVTYEKDGKADQKEMETKLDKFMGLLNIYENEPSGSAGNQKTADDYHDKGDYFRAAFDIGSLANSQPGFSDGYILRGEIFKDKGDHDQAISNYAKAADLDPEYVGTYFGKDFICLLHGIRGEFKEAREEISKVFNSDPLYISAETLLRVSEDAREGRLKPETAILIFKGNALGNIGLPDESLAEYSKAISSEPDYAPSYDIRGLAYVFRRDMDRAISDYDKAIELDPKDVVAYNRRGAVYKAKKEYDRAIENYGKALEVNPSYVKALKNRGNAYYFLGKNDQAIADYSMALQVYPLYVDAYYDRGLSWYAKGNHDQAIADFNTVISKDPNFADAYPARGNAYYAKGDLDASMRDYNKAIEVNPKSSPGYIGRGMVHAKKNEFDQALSEYSRAIEIAPHSSEAYYNRGSLYKARGNHDQAIADFSRAIAANPKNDAAYRNRGSLHRDQADLDKALADYSKAIEIQPGSAQDHYNRGLIYQRKSEFDLALSDYSKAIEINPNYSEAYNNRGNIYRKKGLLDRAFSDYSEAIDRNPKNAEAYYNRGLLYQNRGEFDSALADYNKAIEANPIHADAYHNRGTIYQKKNNYDQAILDFSRAAEINPKYASAYHGRGLSYYYKGDMDRAIINYSKAIEMNPNDDGAYHNRGLAYRNKRNPDMAIADYSKALQIDPNRIGTYLARGTAYAVKGDFQLALSDFDKALALDPKYAAAQVEKGVIFGRKGDYDLAISEFNKALQIDPKSANAYSNRGFTFILKGDMDSALADFDHAIELDPGFALAYINRANAYAKKGNQNNACLDWKKACDLGSCQAYKRATESGQCK